MAQFMIMVYPQILRLTLQENNRIEETVSNLKDAIYRIFEKRLPDLISPHRSEVIDFFI